MALGLKRATPWTLFTWNFQSSVPLGFLSANLPISSTVHLLQALLNLVKFPRAFSFYEFAFLKHLKKNNKNICWSKLLPCKSPLAQTLGFFQAEERIQSERGKWSRTVKRCKANKRVFDTQWIYQDFFFPLLLKTSGIAEIKYECLLML